MMRAVLSEYVCSLSQRQNQKERNTVLPNAVIEYNWNSRQVGALSFVLVQRVFSYPGNTCTYLTLRCVCQHGLGPHRAAAPAAGKDARQGPGWRKIYVRGGICRSLEGVPGCALGNSAGVILGINHVHHLGERLRCTLDTALGSGGRPVQRVRSGSISRHRIQAPGRRRGGVSPA